MKIIIMLAVAVASLHAADDKKPSEMGRGLLDEAGLLHLAEVDQTKVLSLCSKLISDGYGMGLKAAERQQERDAKDAEPAPPDWPGRHNAADEIRGLKMDVQLLTAAVSKLSDEIKSMKNSAEREAAERDRAANRDKLFNR